MTDSGDTDCPASGRLLDVNPDSDAGALIPVASSSLAFDYGRYLSNVPTLRVSDGYDDDAESQGYADYSSSLSSNATASNIPGPGRLLDNLYQSGGRRLEAFFRNRAPATVVEPENGVVANDVARSLQTAGLSTNATASNQPGPGRALDNAYQWAGRKLERFLNALSVRAGRGPNAVMMRINDGIFVREVKDDGEWREETWLDKEKTRRRVRRGCERLLKYTQSKNTRTQFQALNCIVALAVKHQDLHVVFNTQQARQLLDTFPILLDSRRIWERECSPDYESLLGASRKALFALEENRINTVAKGLLEDRLKKVRLYGLQERDRANLDVFIEFLFKPQLAFLAARYIATFWRATWASFDRDSYISLCTHFLVSAAALLVSGSDVYIEHAVLLELLTFMLWIGWGTVLDYNIDDGLGEEGRRLEAVTQALDILVQRKGIDVNVVLENDWDDEDKQYLITIKTPGWITLWFPSSRRIERPTVMLAPGES